MEPSRNEIILFPSIVNFAFELAWITETEKNKIEQKANLGERKAEMYDLIMNMKSRKNAVKLVNVIRCINKEDFVIVVDEEENTTSKDDGKPKKKTEMNHSNKSLLLAISSMLFDKRLITADENRSFVDKYGRASDRRFNLEENSSWLQAIKHPLLLGPVIRCVLGFLPLQDIKTCRKVNKEWNSVGSIMLRARSKISFSKDGPSSQNKDNMVSSWLPSRLPSSFFGTFKDTLSTIPFSSFSILSWSPYAKWTLKQLGDFFERQHMHIRHLELDKLYLVPTNRRKIVDFDITPWLSKCALIKPTTTYNTKLAINCWDAGSQSVCTLLKIPLELIVHVNDLSFDSCQVNLKEGLRITPINLYLSDIMFYLDENILPEICLNTIVDFSRTKTIEISLMTSIMEITNVVLDLSGQQELDSLKLYNVKVTNWDTSRWIVNTMSLSGMKFLEKTQMKIKELIFNVSLGISWAGVIDLVALPDSIEKLSIGKNTTILCSNEKNLPNLKKLHLQINGMDNPEFISHVKQCPNLVEMYLETDSPPCRVKMEWIPKSVKRLKLKRIELIRGMEEDLLLATLILDEYTFTEAKQLCTIDSQVTDLVIMDLLYNCHKLIYHSESPNAFFDFLEQHKHHEFLLGVGPFRCWENVSFDDSQLKQYVDQRAEYYLFERGQGRAIDKNEIDKLAIF